MPRMNSAMQVAANQARGIEVTVKVASVKKRVIMDNEYLAVKCTDGYTYTVQPNDNVKPGAELDLLLQNGFANILE